ncbi:MAG: transposase, partial [Candidatus Omnitrophica bacterium]|nr:transposase [Candidatus Omnitrophota bacterium]
MCDPAGTGQKDLKAILGDEYGGVLISDLLGAYNKIKCRKQRCLVHLLRLIEKWLTYFDYDKRTVKYLTDLKKVIQATIILSNSMGENLPKDFVIRKTNLVGKLRWLLNKKQRLKKADNFRIRILEKV